MTAIIPVTKAETADSDENAKIYKIAMQIENLLQIFKQPLPRATDPDYERKKAHRENVATEIERLRNTLKTLKPV